jgi:hypothetical protein
MTTAVHADQKDALPPEVALAFAPLDKRAFGVAIGTALGLTIFLLTAVYLMRTPDHGVGLALLAQYFKGYSVSWGGALIGFLWGLLVGFVGGWFVAFCRNLVIAASIFIIRAKSELSQTRDFLDHI